jgi:hypothetical protein
MKYSAALAASLFILAACAIPAQAMGRDPGTGMHDPANPNAATKPPSFEATGNPGSPASASDVQTTPSPHEIYHTEMSTGSSPSQPSPVKPAAAEPAPSNY